jgi:hypothetical protein
VGLQVGLEGVDSSHVAEYMDKERVAMSLRVHFHGYKTRTHVPARTVANTPTHTFQHEL